MLSDTQLSCSTAELSRSFSSAYVLRHRAPTTPLRPEPQRFGLLPVRSPLLGESLLFSLPAGTKMFQFPAFASLCEMTVRQTAGLSHSEICGSMAICASPQLIAAYHVLHRLQEPRHPPSALFYFLSPFPLSLTDPCICTVPRKRLLVYFQLSLVKSFSTEFDLQVLLFVFPNMSNIASCLSNLSTLKTRSWRITDSNR